MKKRIPSFIKYWNTDDWTATKRKRKTQQSIVDKLRRQPSLRLPQMQDIAGCRIVLTSGIKQASELNNLLLATLYAKRLESRQQRKI